MKWHVSPHSKPLTGAWRRQFSDKKTIRANVSQIVARASVLYPEMLFELVGQARRILCLCGSWKVGGSNNSIQNRFSSSFIHSRFPAGLRFPLKLSVTRCFADVSIFPNHCFQRHVSHVSRQGHALHSSSIALHLGHVNLNSPQVFP